MRKAFVVVLPDGGYPAACMAIVDGNIASPACREEAPDDL
jgi:hypothetical protein